jgi:MtN3 and saliva related transmembrane protein
MRLAMLRLMTEVIGWLSSAILVLTISTQVHRQWRSGTSKGVSRWLFIGQFVASTGFCVYSVLVRNWVFIATNGLLAVEALVGLAIVRIHRRREARSTLPPDPQSVQGDGRLPQQFVRR